MFEAIIVQSKNVTDIESLAFSSDSLSFAIAQQGFSKDIPNILIYKISDLNNPIIIDSSDTYETPVLSFVRDGKSLIYSRGASEVIELDLQSKILKKLPFLAIQTKGIQSSSYGNVVAIHGLQQFVYNFDIEELVWLCEKEFDQNSNGSFPISISGNGKFFAAYDQDESTIKIFEIENLIEIAKAKVMFDSLSSINISYDGNFIAIRDFPNSYFSLFSIGKKKFIEFSELPDDYFLTIKSVAFHPSNKFLFLGTMSGGLYIIDLVKEAILNSVDIWNKDILVAEFSPDGEKFVFGGQGGALKIINFTKFQIKI